MEENQPPFQYPADLSSLRTAVLNQLAGTYEADRIQACQGFRSGCHSSFCPACLKWLSYKRQQALVSVQSAQYAKPDRLLRFGTFRLRDTPLNELRQIAKKGVKEAVATRNALRLEGSAFALEASKPSWDSNSRHVHLHGILDTAATGRNRPSTASVEAAWMSALPADLRPLREPIEVGRVRTVQGSSKYITKSPFQSGMDDREIADLIETLAALKGTKRYMTSGSLTC